jgi:peptide/nickel transport system ATP-binding protein
VSTALHLGAAACHFRDEATSRGQLVRQPWPAGTAPAVGGAQVRAVSVSFANRSGLVRRSATPVLREVDIDVAAGESLALVGESGSGKTTLLRVLAGLQKPTSGAVTVPEGHVQMVFQDAGASLTPWLTVGELLEDRVRRLPKEQRRARAVDALERLGLPTEVARAKPAQLSGGQRQRVALARAVIEPPQLLLCDEPISALDASLAATVLNLLGVLRRELGFAMVFVTHDLAAARLVSDRVVVMSDGRLVESGDPDQIVLRPTHPYTQALIDAVPRVEIAS